MDPEHLDLATLNALLRTQVIGKANGWSNEVWPSIDSTNSRAAELAEQKAPEGVIVAARQQTAGRGRRGRTWVSPMDSGLYISFLLRPQLPVSALPLMSLGAGVAAVQAIERTCGFAPGLKWVNDIVFAGKKLGGILAEMPSQDRLPDMPNPALIVGIGINCTFTGEELPDQLQNSAIWLEKIVGRPTNANMLAAELALELERVYALLQKGERSRILDEWTGKSTTIGQQVCATSGEQKYEGKAIALAADGGLILRLDDGRSLTLHAGEVTLRNRDGSYSN